MLVAQENEGAEASQSRVTLAQDLDEKSVQLIGALPTAAMKVESSTVMQESEGEEAGESRVTLAQDLGKGNLASRQSRVQLQEVRRLPRLLPLFSVGTSSDTTP